MPRDIVASLIANAAEWPDVEALVLAQRDGEALTYRELVARAASTAAALASLPDPDRPIAILAVSELDVVPALIGCLMADRLCFVYPPLHGAARLAQALASSNAVAAVVDDAGRETVDSAVSGNADAALVAWLSLREIYAGASAFAGSQPPVTARPDAPGIAIFTSGSTGRARGAVISRADLSARAEAESHWFGLEPRETILALLPIYFDVGLTQLLTTLTLGGRHVYLENWWVGSDFTAAIAEFAPAGFAASPVIWSTVMRFGTDDRFWRALAALSYVTISGGDLAPGMVAELVAKTGGTRLFKTYGQTEMFRIASLRPDEVAARPDSVGRAYPGASFTVLASDDTLAAPNEPGEVVAWGMGRMSGYVGGAPGEGLSPAPTSLGLGEGALVRRTGDHGVVDDEGYLYLRGRADDMLKIMDQRVYLLEIEQLIGDVLSIAGLAVINTPSRSGQTTLSLFHSDPTLREDSPGVLQKLRSKLPPHMVPNRVVPLPDMPLLPSGKIDRSALRDHV